MCRYVLYLVPSPLRGQNPIKRRAQKGPFGVPKPSPTSFWSVLVKVGKTTFLGLFEKKPYMKPEQDFWFLRFGQFGPSEPSFWPFWGPKRLFFGSFLAFLLFGFFSRLFGIFQTSALLVLKAIYMHRK